MNGYLIAIIIYALLLIILGIFISKYVKGASDFFVAGRKLNSPLLFTTLIAANVGAGSTVGVAGIGYKAGISSWWWIGASGLGSIILAYIIGPKIWEIAKKYNLYTLGDYLDMRYSRQFRGAISTMMSIGTLALFAGQLLGIAWILNVVADVDKVTGTLIGAAVITLYFAAGGLLSSAIVNIVEIIIIFIGFLLAAPYALSYVGGWQGLQEAVALNMHDQVKTAAYFSWNGIGYNTILGYLFMLVPSFFISPGLIGKVYGARDVQTVKIGTMWNAAVQLLFAFLPAIIGMCAFAAFPALPQPELAMPKAMKEMMPFGISAVALAAIFAAEVSTADAVLYMLTTSLTKDIYKTFFRPDINDTELLKFSRIVTFVCGILGVGMALLIPNIITALSIFYSLMSVSLAAPLIFGLFSTKANNAMAFVAAVTGVITTVLLTFFNAGKGIWILNAQSTGIILAIIIMTGGLLFTKVKE